MRRLLVGLAFLRGVALAGEWEVVPFECTPTCPVGQALIFNKTTGESYSLYPIQNKNGSTTPIFVKVDFLKTSNDQLGSNK